MKDKIEKYVKGIASEDERRDVINWAKQSEENEKRLIQLEADWAFSHMPDSNPSNTAIAAMKSYTAKPNAGKLWGIASSAAAIALLIITIVMINKNSTLDKQIHVLQAENNKINAVPELIQNESTLEYHVNPGVTGRIYLPDGSEVILNSATTLKTPSCFEKGKRVVELDGEGYFKVKSNKDWPMYIRTKKGIIVKVTGTEFNLSSYENDNDLKLTLVSGKVSLMDDNQDKEITVREKEEIIIPNKSSIASVGRKLADMRLNTSWKDGYLVFDNTPIDEVIKKMERWYGVTINIKDSNVKKNVFTASFNSESLRQVLDLMNLTCGVKFRIKDTVVDLY